jgi:hypothetical protein
MLTLKENRNGSKLLELLLRVQSCRLSAKSLKLLPEAAVAIWFALSDEDKNWFLYLYSRYAKFRKSKIYKKRNNVGPLAFLRAVVQHGEELERLNALLEPFYFMLE